MPDYNRRARTPPPRSVTTEGRCRREPTLFDGDQRPSESTFALSERMTAAAFVCASCPVLDECREWAQSQPNNSFHGTVGGERYYTRRYPKKPKKSKPTHLRQTGRTPSEGAAR
ncbi:WhiB family transcriptional regulator [Gordonia sp. NPDC057258]|uniref:WhiB family transcriptional regulator n=1 Tax=unclassified Gordonia (in: high G+C Gram-positive bacteria) TaxID=2657482 RepID=UPI00362951F8